MTWKIGRSYWRPWVVILLVVATPICAVMLVQMVGLIKQIIEETRLW